MKEAMAEQEELIKTEAEKVPEAPEAEPQKEQGETPPPVQAKEDDPYVGVQEGYEEPYLDPIEEEIKYVYQKGDFWAFLIAALRVFLPILLLFVGGILLVYWFFAR